MLPPFVWWTTKHRNRGGLIKAALYPDRWAAVQHFVVDGYRIANKY